MPCRGQLKLPPAWPHWHPFGVCTPPPGGGTSQNHRNRLRDQTQLNMDAESRRGHATPAAVCEPHAARHVLRLCSSPARCPGSCAGRAQCPGAGAGKSPGTRNDQTTPQAHRDTPMRGSGTLCKTSAHRNPGSPPTLNARRHISGFAESSEGTLCHSFSSRGSSRLSCSMPPPRELPLTARASFLPSRPYLARMTRREAGYQSRRVLTGAQAGAGHRCPLPTGFAVTTRDLAGQEKNQAGAHSPVVSSGQADPPGRHRLLYGSPHERRWPGCGSFSEAVSTGQCQIFKTKICRPFLASVGDSNSGWSSVWGCGASLHLVADTLQEKRRCQHPPAKSYQRLGGQLGRSRGDGHWGYFL